MTIWNRLATRLRADERGAIAVWFALSLVPIMILTFGLVDISRMTVQKHQLQDALDAATLMAARSTATTGDQLQTIGAAAMKAELADLDVQQGAGSPKFSIDSNNVISGTASAVVPLTVANLWIPKDSSTVSANTEVVRASNNLEVALVLDTTGSMAGSRITDLKTGAAELVDLVVRDVQKPYYSKVAIVPYSAGVNLDTYADQARGPVRSVVISGVTKAKIAVVTATAHGLINGDKVLITGVSGMTNLNNQTYTVAGVTANTFQLSGIDSRSFGSYSGGGTVTCSGCQNFTFTTASGSTATWGLTKCGTERTGTYAYTDDAPSTAYVGRNYKSSTQSSPCPSVPMMPLSSEKDILKGEIAKLTASGSTAGQIGLAWGWYMVSPNFNELWPSTSQKAAAYGSKELIKVVILMTDGAFNTAYCKGVVSKDFNNGSTSINCNATNGDPFAQAATLCKNIKAKGIILYTVGFDVGNDATATAMLRTCATDPDHALFPATGADLKSAFRSIGQEISSLRIAK